MLGIGIGVGGSGGGGTPGGTNGQVQYNNNGAFAGSPVCSATTNALNCTSIAASNPLLSITGSAAAGANTLITIVGGGQSGQLMAFPSGTNFGPTGNLVVGAPTGVNSTVYTTATNCSSSAAPAVCGSAAAGSVVIAAAATTVTVNTTAVTANSQILLTRDDSLGTKLSVTCNTATVMGEMKVSARTGGTSFTITVQTAPATNPGCISYSIIN